MGMALARMQLAAGPLASPVGAPTGGDEGPASLTKDLASYSNGQQSPDTPARTQTLVWSG